MASAIVNPLIAAEPFEEAVDGPRSPTSEKEMQLFYEEQERQDMQRRLSKRNSRTKSWRRSFARTNSGKNASKTTSEPDSDGYGTGQESLRSPSPTVASPPTAFRSPPPSAVPLSAPATPGPGVGAFSRKPPGRRSTSPSTPMPLPVHVVRDQSHIPWHLRKYEIYQPPAFGARAPPRYLNHHLLSASARERLQRELAASYAAGRVPLPSLTTSVAYSGVGSGMGGSVRSSLSVRRPSFLASSNLGGSAGLAGLETITASPASTAAPLNSPSLDPTSALNNGPAASHRFSTWLKRPPASPHTSTQPLPADATDAMDGTDPFGSMWHHSSPYDAGEMVGRGFVRPRDSSAPETPHGRPSMLSPTAGPSRKGPSPLSQSASAINLTDTEPPLPDPPGSPDLLSGTRTTRKLSKRRSTSATRGGLSSLFTRKTSIDDESPVDSPRGGLRGRSRPPLSPSSLSLAQTQGIAFPTSPHDGREKRPRRKLSKRGRSGSMSSAASVDSIADRQSIETPIHTQFARDLPDARGRDVEIVELPSAKFPARTPSSKPLPQPRARAPSQHHHTSSAPEPSYSAPPAMGYGPPPPSTTTNKPHRERKISAASVSSFLSRITSRDKDKDLPRATSAQETDRKVAPHMLLNHVGKRKGERGSVFGRIARKLSLIRRRSVDAIGVEANESRPSFTVERRGGIQPPTLQRRATLDMPSRTPTFKQPAPQPQSPPSKGPELFAPIDPQLRTSRLINASLSPPPRIPDLALAGDRGSWASLARHVSNAKPREDLEPLAPPPPLNPDGPKHPDSPQSIPRWGIANADKGPGLIMNGSPTDDSPMSLPKPVLTIANPDESEGESLRRGSGKIARESIFVRESGVSVGDQLRMRALPPDPPVEMGRGRESVKPLVVRKSRSRTPSPVKPASGRESPVKRTGRESPVKRTGRESPVKKSGRESPVKPSGRESPSKRRPRRDHSPVKPVRRTEPLKDHSAVGVGSPGMSLRTSAAMGSTTSVDAIQGDDETEFGARPTDANGRVLKRSQPSMDSIGKVHVINPKTSLQKIRVRVVSNPPPVEIAKESSPVKEDPPKLAPSPEPAEPSQRPSRSKSRPRSGYTTGREHSVYGTAASDSTDSIASPVGPRKRMSVADPTMSPLARNKGSPAMSPEMRSHMHAKSASADLKSATPYMTPTDEHAPLHPFSDKPVEYHSMAPISVMHVETSMPTFPKSDWSKADLKAGLYDSKPSTSDAKPGFSFTDSKGGWMDDEVDLPPPKAPFMNEEFSVSKEKLAAQGEFKKHSRESTAESGRRVRDEREAEARKAERAQQRERERVERERVERERAERERLERERAEQERLERERIERERAERERLRLEARAERQREQERLERERIERERAEQERIERERLELERFEREQAEKAKERAERERQRAIRRQREAELEQERERERIKDMERQARERDRERVEKERLERERQELERERIERERAEAARAEWERVERERVERERLERERAERAERAERERVERECIERERMEEEMRRREQPPPLLHSHTGSSSVRRTRHDVDGEREVHVVTMKELRKSKRRTPNDSRSTSPTSTAPPPPPKDDRPFKARQRSQTDVTYTIPITSAIPPPPAQPSMEVIAGVPVLPQGTHVEVAQPFHVRPTSESTIDAPSLKAREAWERDRLDKGQSVLGPGGQRAVIPDIGSPRPAPDPRQRQASSSKIRSQTGPVMHSEPFVLSPVQIHANSAGNVHDYGATHAPYPTSPTFPAARAHHNPLPKPPTIDGPYPLHRPGRAYNNPNRQPGPGQNRSRNPLPEPPRVSSYPLHHNVSPRGVPPGAVR